MIEKLGLTMTSETEYGFTLVIRKGDTNSKVEISGYCSEQDKEVLLATALKTYDAGSSGFAGLTLDEIEDIIKSNLTITDSRLYEGVYAVAVDIEIALKNKNELAILTERGGVGGMITITLQKIRDASPCTDGWKKVLDSKGGKSADMGAEFPLSDVLESNDLDDTLWCLRCLPEQDKLWRKYAVWCARQVQPLMADQRSIDALDVAWRHSDGLATDQDLYAAWAAAEHAGYAAWAAAEHAGYAAEHAARAAAGYAAGAAAGAAAWAAAWAAAGAAQKTKMLQILAAGEWVE